MSKNLVELKPRISWVNRDGGIACKVVKSEPSYTGQPSWNTYLYIHDKAMVDYLWTDDCRKYDWGTVYQPKDILEELDWNGGQTFYHQIIDGVHRYIHIGDDYQHLWDEGKLHDEHELMNRIIHIRKQFLEAWAGVIARTDRQTDKGE